MNEVIAEQVIAERANQVSTRACETVYAFNGHEILLWIITGGTPCLSFHYGPFQEHYPAVEKYSYGMWCKEKTTNHWNSELLCFDHQIADKMATGKVQGPTPEDCFEDGWATFWNFYHSNVRELPTTKVVSFRVHRNKLNPDFFLTKKVRSEVYPST